MSKMFSKNILLTICSKCCSRSFITRNKQWINGVSFVSSVSSVDSGYSSSSSSSESDHEQDQTKQDGYHDDQDGLLYPHHIPTTALQKALLSVGSAAVAITFPWRGDMVAAFGETSGHLALVNMRRKMLADSTGRLILEERPRITTRSVDLNHLRHLPEGTLGQVYVKWLDTNRASPDERSPVHFVDDPELAYVMQRYRDTHDLYHTVLGMPTNMVGEICVKWVEAIQLGLPMCALGALFGPVRLRQKHMELYLRTHLWWAIRNGRQAKFLMNVYYEKLWDCPLDELQRELNIEPPPDTPERKHFT